MGAVCDFWHKQRGGGVLSSASFRGTRFPRRKNQNETEVEEHAETEQRDAQDLGFSEKRLQGVRADRLRLAAALRRAKPQKRTAPGIPAQHAAAGPCRYDRVC